jgi:16S rRNA processing protein RimM
VKTQGRRGEVAVELHTGVEGRFRESLHLSALAKDGARRDLKIEGFWPHKGHLVLKFAGVDSISDAEMLVGCELQVPLEQRAQLEPGWTYVSDLVGCTVFDGDREIGTVEDVRFGAGEAPLLVVKAGAKEFEVPYAEAYLQSVDPGHKQIRMLLPDGLLEVNAPLTEEEKQEQRSGGNAKNQRK